jgi:hypothetical protein
VSRDKTSCEADASSEDEAKAILPHLRSLLCLAEQTNIDAHVHLYCTRSMAITSPTGGVEIHHGRPLLSACVDAGAERVRSQISAVKPRGVFIGVCGVSVAKSSFPFYLCRHENVLIYWVQPQSLVQDTGAAVRSLSPGLKRRVGGLEVRESYRTSGSRADRRLSSRSNHSLSDGLSYIVSAGFLW